MTKYILSVIIVVFVALGLLVGWTSAQFNQRGIGTIIGSWITTNSDFAVADANLLYGGHHQVKTLADLTGITYQRQATGMLVYVIDQDKTYRLVQRGNPPVNTSAGPVQQPTQIGVHWVEAQFGGVCKRGAGQWSVVCLGSGNSANGAYSIAMGSGTIANGLNSIAIGTRAKANETFSIAIGDDVKANERGSIAIGHDLISSGVASTAIGISTKALGNHSTAMGSRTEANQDFATAMGSYTQANGLYSTAMGRRTKANGEVSTAMGSGTIANGAYSVAMGYFAKANHIGSFVRSDYSDPSTDFASVIENEFAIRAANGVRISNLAGQIAGSDTGMVVADINGRLLKQAIPSGGGGGVCQQGAGLKSVVCLGSGNSASGDYSTAMGYQTQASGYASIAMGYQTKANGNYSTAMGSGTIASGGISTAMGYQTKANGNYSIAMGRDTIASGGISTAMGYNTKANGDYSTAMGYQTQANEQYSVAMGRDTIANGGASIAMGYQTQASGYASIAMGYNTKANGQNSTAMGFMTQANGPGSTAMGRSTQANGPGSTAMGQGTQASGYASIAMGWNTQAIGEASLAMGDSTQANGDYSTAMGFMTQANGDYSTAMGASTHANGAYSTAMGRRAKANHTGSFVWADSQDADFASITQNEFAIRAQNGVRISNLAGAGNRMVVADSDGRLSTQAIPSGGGGGSKWTDGTAGSIYRNSNVGVGTSDPKTQLHIVGNSSSPQLRVQPIGGSWVGNSQPSVIDMRATFGSNNGDYWPRRAASIKTSYSGGTWGFERMSFHVGRGEANDDAYEPLERMVINGAGNVGIGTSTPTEALHVSGNVRVSSLQGAGNRNVIVNTDGVMQAVNGCLPGMGNFSIVCLGLNNSAGGQYATVLGGQNNSAGGGYATVGGGQNNSAGGQYSIVLGGQNNSAGGQYSIVLGGKDNATSAAAQRSFAAGSMAKANHFGAFVWADGSSNVDFASITQNEFAIRAASGVRISNLSGQIAGSNTGMVVADINGRLLKQAIPSGGVCQQGAGLKSVVCLGSGNSANGQYSTAMGWNTQANGDYSTAMGYNTQANGRYSTAMGSWTQANGHVSTAMGDSTQANGYVSTAMGRRAKANHNGTFVWADSQDADFASIQPNEFAIRAQNGVRIVGNSSSPQLRVQPIGGSWVGNSQPSVIDMRATFHWSLDQGPRRAASIKTSYSGGTWGFERMSFHVGRGEANDDAYEPLERMVINGAGNVGIGTSTPTEKLHVNGNVLATAYFYSSDERLKHNIHRINGALDTVMALNGYTFNWNDTGKPSVGLIAQQVEKVLPDLVSENNNGYKSVQYANMVAVLIEAVKEQQHIINNLQQRIEKLESARIQR